MQTDNKMFKNTINKRSEQRVKLSEYLKQFEPKEINRYEENGRIVKVYEPR